MIEVQDALTLISITQDRLSTSKQNMRYAVCSYGRRGRPPLFQLPPNAMTQRCTRPHLQLTSCSVQAESFPLR
jgi:hypothetical protein